MTLLLSSRDLERRRLAANGSLAPLAESLAADLGTVVGRPLYVPDRKALLSRDGGRCAKDGALLDFDPFSPTLHKCPTCGATYTGELHDRFWIYWYQLWLAERAVHGAVLGTLGVLPKGLDFAGSVLRAYTDLYSGYPNVDNALGPSRPFFSTYLESIWLLQLTIAADLLESSTSAIDHHAVLDRFRDAVVEPSLRLIGSYDEGMSNRQVWNNAAMIAASRLLGHDDDAEAVFWTETGVTAHLDQALLSDGTWYEGENYHLFAHRGLWYAVTMGEHAGIEIPAALIQRFDAGFSTPFLTSLPDFTLPSRRDSQYAISLRQWRFAEMCELGLARGDEKLLTSALSRLYANDIERRSTGRDLSSAEAERNMPATSLNRADLGWRSLLFARPELPVLTPSPLPSVLLESQGIAVLRRDAGDVYVALDYGHSGGGHGHPDRLNLLLAQGDTRWLDDYGTGSYVDPSLHWYRSTLAHNAPMVDGRSQPGISGGLLGFEDRGAAGIVGAEAPVGPRTAASRRVVVMPDYFVDQLRWTNAATFFDLPLHIDAEVVDASTAPQAVILEGSGALEDGFRFLHDTALLASAGAQESLRLRARRDGRTLDLWLTCSEPFEIYRAVAPAAPGRGEAPFIIVRSHVIAGELTSIWSWNGRVRSTELSPSVAIVLDNERHELRSSRAGLQVTIISGNARSTIDLLSDSRDEMPIGSGTNVNGWVDDKSGRDPGTRESSPRKAAVVRPQRPIVLRLGKESYRQSEATWEDAGRPSATIALGYEAAEMIIGVAVSNAERSFAAPDAVNRLDNENADINGAGVQLYMRIDDATAGYVIVPRSKGHDVAARPIDGWGAGIAINASWAATPSGYTIEVRVPDMNDGAVIDLDIIINEKPSSRERRRGQLVLSGGAGEFIYLRGDRHDPDRLISFLLTNA